MEMLRHNMYLIIFIIVLLERYSFVRLQRTTGTIAGKTYPTDNDSIIVNNMTRNIKNDTLRFIMSTHLLLCPGMDMCSEQYNRSYTFKQDPCCAQCSCLGNCLAGECCPTNLLNNISTFTGETSPKMTCVHPPIADFLETKYILMTTQCKNKGDMLECKELASSWLSPPVTSTVTNKTYLNKECAVCNGEKERNTVIWNGTLDCQHRHARLDIESLEKYILEDQVCKITFQKPKSVPVQECVGDYISECNVTGKWKLYSADIDFGCRSYTSVYRQRYKNVLCYMCNEEETELPIECTSEAPGFFVSPGSFTALLNFNNRKFIRTREKADDDTTLCPENEKYDSYAGICRKVTCPRYLTYDPETFTCVQAFTIQKPMQYAMYVKLIPFGCHDDCCDLYDITPKSLLSVLHTDSRLKHCERVVYKKEDECLSYFTVLFDIIVDDDAIEHISHMLSNDGKSLKVYKSSKSGEFVMFKVIVMGLDFIPRSPLNSKWVFRFLEQKLELAPLNFFNGNETKKLNFKTYQNHRIYNESQVRIDSEDGSWIFEIYIEERRNNSCFVADVVKVSYHALCPQITVHETEIQKELGSTDITLRSVNLLYTSAEYSFLNDTVSLCAEKYFEMIRNFTNLTESNEDNKLDTVDIAEGIVSMICTIASVISLILTIVTYSIFQQLRTLPGKNNMALCLTLLLAHVTYPYAYLLNVNKTLCTVVAISIHFFWLSAVFWMNVCCVHMFRVFWSTTQMMTLSSSQRPFIIYCLWSIVGPCVCICTNILVSHHANGGVGYGGPLCYITSQDLILYVFGLPVALLVLSNFVMFIVVVVKLQRTANMETSSNYERNKLKIYAKLSTLTGMSWVFGFLYQLTGFTPLSFAFIILTAGQGIMILLAFVCNARVKTMYIQRFSKPKSFVDSDRTFRSTLTSQAS